MNLIPLWNCLMWSLWLGKFKFKVHIFSMPNFGWIFGNLCNEDILLINYYHILHLFPPKSKTLIENLYYSSFCHIFWSIARINCLYTKGHNDLHFLFKSEKWHEVTNWTSSHKRRKGVFLSNSLEYYISQFCLRKAKCSWVKTKPENRCKCCKCNPQ